MDATGEGLALLPVASQTFLCSSLWRDRVLLALRGSSLPLVRGGSPGSLRVNTLCGKEVSSPPLRHPHTAAMRC